MEKALSCNEEGKQNIMKWQKKLTVTCAAAPEPSALWPA